MRIYLLVLVLAVLAQSKFRHLRNLTITIPGEIILKGLSSSEIAYQYQDTIVIYDINRNQQMQTIKQPAASPMQFVPSTNALIYPSGNNINQVRSNANQRIQNKTLSDQSWMPNIGAAAGDVVTAIYGPSGKDRILEIYGTGTNPSDYKRLTWAGFPKEDTNVGSGVSVVSADEFYFAVGGACIQNKTSQIYLQQGSRAGIKNVYKFTYSGCRLLSNDYEWTLQSYKINEVRYHLLSYKFFSDINKLSVTQLISNQTGKYEESAHFQIDRQIGAEMTSKDVVYTADNILCRVLRHDIQNHDHGHKRSAFKDLPYWTFVTPSEKYVTALSVSDTTYLTSAQILKVVDKDLQSLGTYTFQVFADRVEILNDQYVLVSSQTKDNRAILSMSDLNGNTTLKEVRDNVFDFCVSDQKVVFISDFPTAADQTIAAYKIVDGQLQVASTPITVTKNSSLSLKCLNDNHILLAPAAGGNNTIYVYAYDNVDTFTLRSQNKSNSTARIQFQAVNNIIITSPPDKNNSKFYDYDLKQLPLSFNLPANSVYEIVQATNGGLLVAVGDDLKHFVSLQYYIVDESTVTYKGTYPHFDSGQSNRPASVLLTKTGTLHIQYSGWSTYFDLNAPPMTSFGYFYGADNQCSGFQEAIFQPTTGGQPNMIVLNTDTPAIQVYSITDKLEKKSTDVIFFKKSRLSLNKSSNPNQIVISGINDKTNHVIEVRNINALSKPTFTNEKAFTASQKKIKSTQAVNQFVVSAFTDNSSILTLYFDTNSNNPIPIQNNKFKAITLLATCPACSKIAFTGELLTPVTGATIIVQDYEDATSFNYIDASCQINLLAVSPSGGKLAYNCDTNKLIVNTGLELALPQTFTTISDLAFLDENSLIANLDGTATTILITPGKLHALKGGLTAGSSLYAVDYSKQIYAVTNGPTTVDFYNVAGPLIQSVTLDSIDQISSMSFNSDSQLVAITVTGTIVVLTADACNINQQLVKDYFCVCKSLFKQDLDQCNCQYKYDSSAGNCNCNDGYFYVGGNNCDECSAMCSTCSSGGAFSCDDFGVWFYIIIIGTILIVAGGVLFTVFRIKKNKQKEDSIYTEERTKMSEPFLSEKGDKSEGERKGSKNKLYE